MNKVTSRQLLNPVTKYLEAHSSICSVLALIDNHIEPKERDLLIETANLLNRKYDYYKDLYDRTKATEVQPSGKEKLPL